MPIFVSDQPYDLSDRGLGTAAGVTVPPDSELSPRTPDSLASRVASIKLHLIGRITDHRSADIKVVMISNGLGGKSSTRLRVRGGGNRDRRARALTLTGTESSF